MQRLMLPRVNAPQALVLDLLEWLDAAPRAYADVMEVWRTNCPRLPVWEDALDLGLVQRRARVGHGAVVEVTPAGIEWLRARRSSR
jgi:hypothetical protein